MSKASTAVTAALIALALGGCGEQPQTVKAPFKKSDAHASEGADNAYMAGGWRAGDKTSWEQQMRTRAQGQNEYNRSN